MKRILCIILAGLAAAQEVPAQSLADAARKEAERRRELAERGIEAKTIEGDTRGSASRGNITTFSPGPAPKIPAARNSQTGNHAGAGSYRNRLQKIDRELVECEERLILLRRQEKDQRWILPKAGRGGQITNSSSSRERLRNKLAELEKRIRQLRRERLEIYEAGRKAGFLPGELDGKGITP